MGYGARRWLIGLGTVAAAGASVLGQAASAAGAVGLGARQESATGSVVVKAQAPGSVYVPTTQTLTLGSHGPAVKALQQRLNFLHYYAGRADGHLGWSTMEAVWAFKEVQTGKVIPPNPDIVGSAMQRQLVHPRLPKVFYRHGGAWRIEINKAIQVMVLYKNNKIALISHTSTAKYYRSDGSGWVTPDGHYRALSYISGWACGSLGCMWNPVFFITTLFAIHGEPNPPATFSEAGVPLNPASHGCVRIPWDISMFFHRLVRIGPSNGTPVYIVGPNYYH
jgi:peptidoglycan hydrolase-like protein with peptidoglycan-binding domain